jgi:hypothetical protein
MNAADFAVVFGDAADAADADACHEVAQALRLVANEVAQDPVLGVDMWEAMRAALFAIRAAERRR